jgi:Tfp pilus assembly protein PilF
VHRLFGEALAHSKKLDEAIFELESAVLCSPKPEEALQVFVTMARTFAAKGDKANARKAAEKALEIDPHNIEAKAVLAGS